MAQNSVYNIEYFEPAAPSRASTAPKIQKNNNKKPNLELVKPPRISAAELKAQAKAANKRVLRILAFSSLILFFLGLVIYSTLELDEINREISKVDKEMKIAQSETVRLNMELDSLISIDKVENYAANTLGMVKVQDYQVVYVDLSTSDRVLMVGGKETEPATVINSNNG